jgi:hypothetical protein
MALPVAAGYPDYGSTGTSKFIPQIWSTKLVIKFYKATVFGDISNTDYEGEIRKYGDKVIIRTTPDTQIKTYSKGMKLVYDQYESANVELNIDHGKYFAFTVDSVDRRQADIKFVEKWSEDASEQMKIAVDGHVLNAIYPDAHAKNKGATAGLVSSSYDLGAAAAPESLTKDNILGYIVDCGSVLSEQNVPETGRWMVIPIWMANYLKKSDLKDASMTGDTVSPLRNGRIGVIDQFTLYISNNYTSVLDTVACYNVLFGTKAATTFAAQMTEMETLPNPDSFGQLIRGLNVYGFEVIKPEALGVLYCTKGS